MIDYKLIRKRIKNINMRVNDGVICVSAPPRVPKIEINKFVQSKAKWIEKQLAKPPVAKPVMKHFDDDICLEKFNKIADSVYPLIAKKIKFKPRLRVKDYKSRWGVCFTKRGYIILNKQLFDKPIPAIEYVILHEYVHFLAPNHGAKFHKIMADLMPDYKQRKRYLK
ncbi:MAG: M48 family metallopeptidase [Oscillospiraceae bacterium]|nr:M48 family metallopeptidase [Oscillospiraceae bacterium]